ncbi:MAG: exo-alpha-sialidase [Lentisphaerae bacterium]|nr:exo-alpha-sialidase [Lentisphaerota bacterium]
MKTPALKLRATYLTSDGSGSLYSSADYASATEPILIQDIRTETLSFTETGAPRYLTGKLVWQRSTDNGRTWQMRDEWRLNLDQPDSDRPMSLGSFLLPGPNVVVERSIIPSGFPISNVTMKRALFRHSTDAGLTWSEWQQAIDSRPGYNSANWAPGIVVGQLGGVCDGQVVLEDNHTALMGFTIREPHAPPEDISARAKEVSSYVICGRAVWNSQARKLDWTFSEPIKVPFPIACGGCCEPALVRLNANRWMMTMRCQGDAKLNIPSRRMAAMSHDGGLTWGEPFELLYDTGSPVWMPASFHRFFHSSRTGHTWLIGNFLPGPVHGQTPRYPLAMAEIDLNRGVILRDTLFVIQDQPPGAPTDRRYTNFGLYEDRLSGELVLLLPEHPQHKNYSEMTEPSDYVGDCLIYRIAL